MTSECIPEEDAYYRVCNMCVITGIQKRIPGWAHKGCVLQRISIWRAQWRHGCSQDETKYIVWYNQLISPCGLKAVHHMYSRNIERSSLLIFGAHSTSLSTALETMKIFWLNSGIFFFWNGKCMIIASACVNPQSLTDLIQSNLNTHVCCYRSHLLLSTVRSM